MPKKTRKEKLAAQKRRQQQSLSAPRVSPDTEVALPTPPPDFAYQFQTQSLKQAVESTQSQAHLTDIRSDLIKTMVLSALAISVEAVLTVVLA